MAGFNTAGGFDTVGASCINYEDTWLFLVEGSSCLGEIRRYGNLGLYRTLFLWASRHDRRSTKEQAAFEDLWYTIQSRYRRELRGIL